MTFTTHSGSYTSGGGSVVVVLDVVLDVELDGGGCEVSVDSDVLGPNSEVDSGELFVTDSSAEGLAEEAWLHADATRHVPKIQATLLIRTVALYKDIGVP